MLFNKQGPKQALCVPPNDITFYLLLFEKESQRKAKRAIKGSVITKIKNVDPRAW